MTFDPSSCQWCATGTVNTKMLIQGWGSCGIDIKVQLKLRCMLHAWSFSYIQWGAMTLNCCCFVVVQQANDEYFAATDPSLEGVSGAFCDHCQTSTDADGGICSAC